MGVHFIAGLRMVILTFLLYNSQTTFIHVFCCTVYGADKC